MADSAGRNASSGPPWSSTRPPRRTRAARPPLDRRQIATAGLRIVDEEGADALLLRRLAEELGVAPMSIYWHVKDKAELLEVIGHQVFAEIEIPIARGDWRDQLRDVHRAMLAGVLRHPNTTDILIGRAPMARRPGALRADPVDPPRGGLLAGVRLRCLYVAVPVHARVHSHGRTQPGVPRDPGAGRALYGDPARGSIPVYPHGRAGDRSSVARRAVRAGSRRGDRRHRGATTARLGSRDLTRSPRPPSCAAPTTQIERRR